MNEAEAREVISSAFVAGWTAAQPAVPFSIENEFDKASDRFAALSLRFTTSRQMTAGRKATRRFQHDGWILIKLWVPAGEGVAGVGELAATVRALFQATDLYAPSGGEPVTTMATSSGAFATEGRWFMQVMQTPFWYVETA